MTSDLVTSSIANQNALRSQRFSKLIPRVLVAQDFDVAKRRWRSADRPGAPRFRVSSHMPDLDDYSWTLPLGHLPRPDIRADEVSRIHITDGDEDTTK